MNFERRRQFLFFFNDTATTEIYTLSLHDALPISGRGPCGPAGRGRGGRMSRGLPFELLLGFRYLRSRGQRTNLSRSEEHTSELQSRPHLVCRLLLEKIIRTVRTLR